MQDSAEFTADGDEQEIENGIERKYLTFRTDSELFGIPISDVVQIISIQEITPLPDFPAYVKCVINLRGSIIPVIDIRVRFGKPNVPYTESTCIIVTRVEDTCIGFIVDSVDEVTDIGDDDITDAPKVSKEVTNKYLTGIGRIGERVVLLLDVGKILTENEYRTVCETAVRTAEPVPAEKAAPAGGSADGPKEKAVSEKEAEAGGNVTPISAKKAGTPAAKNK